jgi:hypothetical protein
MKNSLKSTDWLFSIGILIVIASIVIIAKANACKAFSKISDTSLVQEYILVLIDGSVKKPGQYSVRAGTTIGQALRKARPEANADLKDLPLGKIIDAPMHLHVSELKEIRVKVKGAIAAPTEIILPAKSRIKDLKSKVIFTDSTDKAFFRRKKLLRDGDEIDVPKKTVEVNSPN